MKNRFYIPTKILFGINSLDSLHEEKLPGKKALIVTSTGQSAIRHGYLDRLVSQLSMEKAEHAVFSKIRTNPTRSQVMEGADICREQACDFVIALGGGSCIDAAKAIAIVAANGGDLWDYFHSGTAKAQPIKNLMLPVAAVPTTAGTGSETDQWMVISNPERNEKIGFGYSKSFPTLAIVDPSLMLSVPPDLTALHGIDALFHATEGYLSSTANPFSDAFAIRSIQLIGKSLSEAVKNGDNLKAREDMAMASTLSGMVMAVTSLVAEHAMGEGLSGIHHDLPHGVGLVLICEAYYRLIAELGHSERRLVEMAGALGNEKAETGMDFADTLVELLKACGIYGLKMSDYGIAREEFTEVVRLSKAHAKSEFSAEKKLLTDEECMRLLENSYQ
jgi:alcohol dehydrogenase